MNPVNAFFKLFYWPICRAYARHLGDKPADSLLRFLCSFQFLRTCGFWPNFVNPRRFSEKVWSLQLHGRDPILTLISDKLRVRDYVAHKVGEKYLIPLIWQGEHPGNIPFDELPQKFVIKANHGCDFNILIKDKNKINQRQIEQQLKKLLDSNFCRDTFLGISWGYRNIKPHIIIEELLQENGKDLIDYKFWCFFGRVEFISLHFDRFENHATLSFDRNFQAGGLHFDLPIYEGHFERPPNYKEMITVAEALAEDFKFMRVDLYNVDRRIYFGELTPYPGGVTARFEPEEIDLFLGEKWVWKSNSTSDISILQE